MIIKPTKCASPIRLEIFTPGDEGLSEALAGELLALFKQTIRSVNSRDYSPAQIAAWASDEIDPEQWRRRFAGRFVIVAKIGESLAGFADVKTIGETGKSIIDSESVAESGRSISPKTTPKTDGYLDRFFVAADFQRCGVGTCIFAAMAAAAARYGWKRLCTEASITARPFFESRGFRTIREQTVECRGERFVNYQMEWFPTDG